MIFFLHLLSQMYSWIQFEYPGLYLLHCQSRSLDHHSRALRAGAALCLVAKLQVWVGEKCCAESSWLAWWLHLLLLLHWTWLARGSSCPGSRPNFVQASLRISRWDHQGWPWLVSALSDLSTVMLVLGISPRYVIYFTHFAPHSSQKPFAHLC